MVIELFVLSLVGCVLIFSYIAPKIRLSEENGVSPLIQCNCSIVTKGAVFQLHGLPGVARVALYDDFIVLSNLLKTKISYSVISSVVFKKRLILSDFLVITTYGEVSSVVIYTNRSEAIYNLIMEKITNKRKTNGVRLNLP
jgi:hypothetical protein